MAAKRAAHEDDEDEFPTQKWEDDYEKQIDQFKFNGEFKKYVIATDSEFGPEWAVRNHSPKIELLKEDGFDGLRTREFEVLRKEDDTGDTFKEKVLYDDKNDLNVKHLDPDKNLPLREFLNQCRTRSATTLKKQVSSREQWYGSTSGPIWARLYSTVFWVFVENGDGTTETHRLVFPWYIYRSEHVSLEAMCQMAMPRQMPSGESTKGDPLWFQPQNVNRTPAEHELLRCMARCWIELISNAQHVIAWSQQGVDILNPLDWFVLNDVFQVTAEDRIRVLLRLGWQQKPEGWPGDLTFSSKNRTRYVDLSAAFAENKRQPKLEDAARRWLQNDPKTRGFKTLEPKQLDHLFAVADNRTEALDVLCLERDHQQIDGLIFSRYDELCYFVTRHSLLSYNDMDVSLMYQLMSIGKSKASLENVVPFMYNKNGQIKFQRVVSHSNPLIFADWHADVRCSILAREKRAGEPGSLKRQNAGVWGRRSPAHSVSPESDRENPYLV